MTGDDFKAVREKLDLSLMQFGERLGYAGNDITLNRLMRRFESGNRPVPPHVADVARWYEKNGLVENVTAPTCPRIAGGLLLYGEPHAVQAYLEIFSTNRWLESWHYRTGGRDTYQFSLSPPASQYDSPGGPSTMNGTGTVAAIMAHDPIIIGTLSSNTLLGARLSVAYNHAPLAVWLRERAKLRHERRRAEELAAAGVRA